MIRLVLQLVQLLSHKLDAAARHIASTGTHTRATHTAIIDDEYKICLASNDTNMRKRDALQKEKAQLAQRLPCNSLAVSQRTLLMSLRAIETCRLHPIPAPHPDFEIGFQVLQSHSELSSGGVNRGLNAHLAAVHLS